MHRVFNTLDKGTHAYSVARFDPTRPLEHKVSNAIMNNPKLQSDKPVQTNDVAPEYNVTNLTNGFTVLTESQTFPGAVHMGK